MRRLVITVSAVLLAALGSAPAGATIQPRQARGVHAQATMYATVIGDGNHRIQVLNRLCPQPRRLHDCDPLSGALRHTLSDASSHPIRWVDRMHKHLGTFWVFAPVRWNKDHAGFLYRWDETQAYGCEGGGRAKFTLSNGAWMESGGNAFEGCP
jgi:hypothetical protein